MSFRSSVRLSAAGQRDGQRHSRTMNEFHVPPPPDSIHASRTLCSDRMAVAQLTATGGCASTDVAKRAAAPMSPRPACTPPPPPPRSPSPATASRLPADLTNARTSCCLASVVTYAERMMMMSSRSFAGGLRGPALPPLASALAQSHVSAAGSGVDEARIKRCRRRDFVCACQHTMSHIPRPRTPEPAGIRCTAAVYT